MIFWGIETIVNPQPKNAQSPISSRLLGKVISDRFLHKLNAISPITFTPSPNVAFSSPDPWNASLPIFETLPGIMIALKLVHLVNAEFPIISTPSAMITSSKFSQYWNAPLPIVLTHPGIITFFIFLLLAIYLRIKYWFNSLWNNNFWIISLISS